MGISNHIFHLIDDPLKIQRRIYQRIYRSRTKDKHKDYTMRNKALIAIYNKRYYAKTTEARKRSLDINNVTPVNIVCELLSTEGLDWFDTIRTNILNGISTNTLPSLEQNRFWTELNARVAKQYPLVCGNHNQKRNL